MRPIFRLFCALGLGLGVSGAAHADLPDLRGQTLFLSGTVLASGTVLTFDLSSIYPNGEDIPPDNPIALAFAATGPSDDSALTATISLPPFPPPAGTTYPTCPNPILTLNGSFNRATGVFTMTGKLPGASVIDFGVEDLGPPFGVRRTLVQTKNLVINLNGTGAIGSDGVFAIKQPGVDDFTFDINNSFGSNGTPRAALQDPNLCGFGGTVATVQKPKIQFSDWTGRQAQVSGQVMLEGRSGATTIQPIAFTFRPAVGLPFTINRTLGSDGTFLLPNIPAGVYTLHIKGAQWLAANASVDTTKGDLGGLLVGLIGGDANNDNSVDNVDLSILALAYAASTGDSNFDARADFNGDGSVDNLDLSILANNYALDGDN